MHTMIDAHIHLDQYEDRDIEAIIGESERYGVEAVITVSTDKQSCERNLQLAHQYSSVYPAFGYHPEQALPSDQETAELLSWMTANRGHMVAVGEVGLPYYLRQTQTVHWGAYKELLACFIQKAAAWRLPVVLHAVYEDAEVACDLLEAHSVKEAHFHWFKGSQKTAERLKANGYYISFAPDVCYKETRKRLAAYYPLELTMVETDGPWPFDGPFQSQQTRPKMIRESLAVIAALKEMPLAELCAIIRDNTHSFYRIKPSLGKSK